MGEESEYRLVYNWGQSTTEICEVWSFGGKPQAYMPLGGVSTHDDDSWAFSEADEPSARVRALLTKLLEACDKPLLRFPEDFDA